MINSRFWQVGAAMVAGMALLTACGGSSGEASTSSPSATSSASKSASASATNSATPTSTSSPTSSTVPGERVPTAELATVVSDRTFSGSYDGTAYAEYYAPDGTLRGEEDGQTYSGSWAVEGDRLCFTYPDSNGGTDEVDCYTVYRDGDEIIWVDEDGNITTANFEEGNPRGL